MIINPKNPINYLLISFIIFGIFQLFIFSTETGKTTNSTKNNTLDNYQIISLSPPSQLSFAGEEIPLSQPDVYESLDREIHANTYFHSNTILYFKRANRWFPTIEKILAKNNIPDDFKYLALIESGLQHVVSPAGATGYWQFLKETAKEYGLVVNDEIDERYHVEKSTEAACRYLNDAYKKYGNWTLVAASYNVGMARISNELDRQKTNNYYDMLLNQETARYVFRIAAVKEIMNHPEKYGFTIKPEDLYPEIEYKLIPLDKAVVDFAEFAAEYDISYKVLKYFNPWLRQSYLKNPAIAPLQIKIPENSNYKLNK